MYYYGGYSGGYGNNCGCNTYAYPVYSGHNGGYGAAIILVLFILLVIIIGSRIAI